MRGRIGYIICAIMIVLNLAGCSVTTVENSGGMKTPNVAGEQATSMFVMVEETAWWRVVYHKETLVMYVVSDGSYNRGTFTVLVNADGTPMLWAE